MGIELSSLKKAVSSLERAINVAIKWKNEINAGHDELETIKAGVIQKFEFVYEQCWKIMKRWLEENVNPESVDGITRKELFRMSVENRLITEIESWMEFHRARNMTSHTYNEETANEVFEVAVKFLPYTKDFLERMERVK